MKCMTCGAEQEPGVAHCAACGGPVSATCPSCGATLAGGTPFCPGCGAATGASVQRREESATQPLKSRGLLWRLGATVIDGAIYVFLFAFAAVNAGVPEQSLISWTGIVMLLAFCTYYIIFEGTLGTTPGKWLLRMKVVNRQGRRPGMVLAIIRNLVRIIDMLPLGYVAGIVAIATSPAKQRIGDKGSLTMGDIN